MDFNALKRYGIKEVMNVTMEALDYDLDKQNQVINYPGDIVLQLDSLKVSTLEFTAEQVYAQGGWGNPRLIGWDFGKEITLTLEDALISPEFMRIMMGGRTRVATQAEPVKLRRTKKKQQTGTAVVFPTDDKDIFDFAIPFEGMMYKWINTTTGKKGQMVWDGTEWKPGSWDGTAIVPYTTMAAPAPKAGEWMTFFYEILADGEPGGFSAAEITISPELFPGTYRLYGETMIRDERGQDSTFLLTIPRAKVSSSVTLTMQAEGDPATFEMTVDVMRDESGDMLTLVPYEFIPNN